MRFFRSVLFALFWVAIGLGVGVLPLNGTTVWEKVSAGLKASVKTGGSGKASHSPLGNYTAEERAAIDKLILRGASN